MQTNAKSSVVIVAYKPKPGHHEDLLQLTREHLPILRAEGLATELPEINLTTSDGTVIEIFEWAAGGMEKAHANPAVRALWTRYAAACDIVPLASLPEAAGPFAAFERLSL